MAPRLPSIVHIGYHKTATNWFQKVCYPAVTNAEYLHRKRARQAFLADSGLHFDPERAREALGLDRRRRVILCEEELSGNIHTGGLYGCFTREIARRIATVLPEAQVVIFVREQVDMIASAYKQYVKEGGTHGVNRYLHPGRYLPESGFQPAKAALFDFAHFDYAALVDHYDTLFGRERVQVFAYEDFRRDNRAFLEDYVRRLELDVDLDGLGDTRPNPPYGRGVLPLARLLNHFTYRDLLYKRCWLHLPLLYKLRGSLLERLDRLPGLGAPVAPQRLLGRQNVALIRARYAESNRWLARRTGLALEAHGYAL